MCPWPLSSSMCLPLAVLLPMQDCAGPPGASVCLSATSCFCKALRCTRACCSLAHRRAGVQATTYVCGEMGLGLLEHPSQASWWRCQPCISMQQLLALDGIDMHDNRRRGCLLLNAAHGCRCCQQQSWCLATSWRCQVGPSAASDPLLPLPLPCLMGSAGRCHEASPGALASLKALHSLLSASLQAASLVVQTHAHCTAPVLETTSAL